MSMFYLKLQLFGVCGVGLDQGQISHLLTQKSRVHYPGPTPQVAPNQTWFPIFKPSGVMHCWRNQKPGENSQFQWMASCVLEMMILRLVAIYLAHGKPELFYMNFLFGAWYQTLIFLFSILTLTINKWSNVPLISLALYILEWWKVANICNAVLQLFFMIFLFIS